MIIKMVRNMLLLRWLCSDVTAANAAALSEERPDVTFVSRNEYDYQCQELTTDVRQF
jgi:membrane-bound inhibitor of C-type lysozyme